jgi:hypothetical protein
MKTFKRDFSKVHYECQARVRALEAEVARIRDQLFEMSGRYRTAYVAWLLSGKGEEERKYAIGLMHQFEQLRADRVKAYDLLHEAKQDLAEK